MSQITKTHEDERLNSLIGKRVRITFNDGDVDEGILGRSEYSQRYALERLLKGDVHFYKSHVKNVEELQNGYRICKVERGEREENCGAF